MVQRTGSRAHETDFPRYGEIHEVELDPTVGAVMGKRRPALVVSRDANNRYAETVTVLPITGQPASREYPFEVFLPRGVGGLTLDSRVKANQIRTVDKRQLVGLRGELPLEYISQIHKALKIHLNLI